MYSALVGSFLILTIGMLMACAMDGFAPRGKTARRAVARARPEKPSRTDR